MSHPTSDEIQVVRYRLGKLGTGDTNRLSDAMVTEFWREVQADVEADAGISYNSGNYLQRGCVADGTAAMVLGMIIGDTLLAKNIMLGEFRVEEQGLNWNVGVFEAARMNYESRFMRRLNNICANKIVVMDDDSDYSDSINSALATIANEAGIMY